MTQPRVADRSVLVSGIGIAGTTTAYWLRQRGFAPTLVEQAPSLRTGGYVIDFWGRGFDVAERMGLLPELRAEGYDIRELRLVDGRGRRVGGFGVDVFRALTGDRYVSLGRGQLAEMIFRKIDADCETIFGDRITGITQHDDGVDVRFRHAAARRFGFVVGADGLHSAVRERVFGPEDRFERYLGYTVAAFETEGYRPRDEGVYISYSAPGKQVARFAMRGDRTLFLFVFAAPRPPPVQQNGSAAQKAMLHAEFDDAGWECPRILAALDACNDVYFDRVSQIRTDAWSRGRVVLVGDAAFCPSLLAGQGAALAMIAAYVLACELDADGGAPQEAFRRYERALRPFMLAKQNAAERLARAFVPRTRLGMFWRNQVTKALGLPLVARLVLGRSLLDRIDLPDGR